jgi:hypothetical protein
MSEHAASRRRLAVTREAIWISESAEAATACLSVEGDDPERFTRWLVQSDLPYDRWFAERARQVWPLDGFAPPRETVALFESRNG